MESVEELYSKKKKSNLIKLQRLVSRGISVYYIKKSRRSKTENFSNQNVKENSFIKF